jgi:hypothetical protein
MFDMVVVFPLNIRYYYAFITKQMQKNTFFEWNIILNYYYFQFLNLINVYPYHTP